MPGSGGVLSLDIRKSSCARRTPPRFSFDAGEPSSAKSCLKSKSADRLLKVLMAEAVEEVHNTDKLITVDLRKSQLYHCVQRFVTSSSTQQPFLSHLKAGPRPRTRSTC